MSYKKKIITDSLLKLSMEAKYRFKSLTTEEKNVVKKHFKGNKQLASLVKKSMKSSKISNTCGVISSYAKMMLTSPKCGTTWTQETTWHIMNGVHLERTHEPLLKDHHS